MSSPSARVSTQRPFYARHADAYDALITDPVDPWADVVHSHLARTGVACATLLDAGCGTGRHAEGLIKRGQVVELLDASEELLTVARRRCPTAGTHHGDICCLSIPRVFDAVVCRGVLNDLVTDAERDNALSGFANVVGVNGSVILDLRESEWSKARADGVTRRREVDLASGDRLVFSSTPQWHDGLIAVQEQYDLIEANGRHRTEAYAFRMRPWTVEEIRQRLSRVGFDRIEISPGHGRRALDRLFVVARRAVH